MTHSRNAGCERWEGPSLSAFQRNGFSVKQNTSKTNYKNWICFWPCPGIEMHGVKSVSTPLSEWFRSFLRDRNDSATHFETYRRQSKNRLREERCWLLDWTKVKSWRKNLAWHFRLIRSQRYLCQGLNMLAAERTREVCRDLATWPRRRYARGRRQGNYSHAWILLAAWSARKSSKRNPIVLYTGRH